MCVFVHAYMCVCVLRTEEMTNVKKTFSLKAKERDYIECLGTNMEILKWILKKGTVGCEWIHVV
jgi:hypothetical protein